MTTNEEEVELIEHPVSSNKHNSSCSSSTIVKMWVLLEGSPSATKLRVSISEVKDLYDFKYVLKEEFKELGNASLQNIEFFDNNYSLLLPDTDVQTFKTNTAKNPIIVRYSISSANLKISFKFGNHELYECELPHNSGSFNLLKKIVIEKHSELKAGNFYFTYGAEGLQIENEYNFNNLVSKCNDYVISTLKVVEKGKKSFSSWNIKEVFSEILQDNYKSFREFSHLDMEKFDPLEREFDEEDLKNFVWELKRNLEAFDEEISTNSRIYINTFIMTAVKHVRKIKNKKSLRLCLETGLNGTRGSGSLDYAVILGTILLLLVEAKSEDMNQGIAQALVQVYTLMEKLFQEFSEPIAYGVVTTGTSWRFFRWTGSSLNEPVIHITKEFRCELDINSNMKKEKEILKYIAQILQVQVDAYDGDSERPSKRVKIE